MGFLGSKNTEGKDGGEKRKRPRRRTKMIQEKGGDLTTNDE
jgi:hypothetical protein